MFVKPKPIEYKKEDFVDFLKYYKSVFDINYSLSEPHFKMVSAFFNECNSIGLGVNYAKKVVDKTKKYSNPKKHNYNPLGYMFTIMRKEKALVEKESVK